MTDIPWLTILGWNKDQLDDIRFVGYSYIRQGRYEIALSLFEALHVLEPTNDYHLQTLGALHLQMGNNLAALDFLERAIKVSPNHGPTLLNRIKALILLGYKKQALIQAKSLEKSGEIDIARQAEAILMAHG